MSMLCSHPLVLSTFLSSCQQNQNEESVDEAEEAEQDSKDELPDSEKSSAAESSILETELSKSGENF